MMIFKRYFAELIWVILLLFLSIALLPPFLYKSGHDKAADSIHSVYRLFCHQRVERSPFLLGEKGAVNFYSINELKLYGAIPEFNPNIPTPVSEQIFGYPYVGNEYIGYKTALCVRDLAIYIAILIVGALYLICAHSEQKSRKFKWGLIIALLLPMTIDGLFQLFAEMFAWEFVPYSYITSISKRIITGALFGAGFALFVFSNLKENTDFRYNEKD